MVRSRTVAPRASAVLALLVTLAPFAPVFAADEVYRTPPAPVGDILDAPRLPSGRPQVSPDGTRMLVPDLPSLIPIAALAEPVEKLAGLEIVPGLRASRNALKSAATGLSIASLTGGHPVRAKLAARARIVATAWSNDSRSVACALLAPEGAEIWIVDAATGEVRRIPRVRLNGVTGVHMEWSNDDASIFCGALPSPQLGVAGPSAVPTGPRVRVGAGRAAAQRTSRNVLTTANDQDRFNWYLQTQLLRVPVSGAEPEKIGAPFTARAWSLAPDEKHVLVESITNAPLGFPFYLFPTRTEIWNLDGKVAATVGESPLNDRSAISSVAPLGPREVTWAPDGQAVCFFSWVDAPGAEPMKAVRDTTRPQPGTDRLMRLAAPFTGSAAVLATSPDMQYSGMAWVGESDRLALRASYDPRRIERRLWLDVAKPGDEHVLTLRSTEGAYDNPGFPLTRHVRHGDVLWTTPRADGIYLAAPGYGKAGQRPRLDRMDLATGKRTTLFESDAAHLEVPVALLDADAKRFVITRESSREPRNYWVRRAGRKDGTEITDFKDPAPALTASQRVPFTFTRKDGVTLNAEAVLPADWKAGNPLPTIFWIYPNDYRSAAAASENRRSPNRFPSQSPLNPEVLVTQGYCVVYPDIAVVGTNDQYVEQIRLSAQAAVDECVKRGFTDRRRIGVGGHSYGAFSSANMLAHTDLFRAGIASDGAYNRTLTPFTFQAEERTLWQAPQTYLDMSPFMHADQIQAPLLLLHNLDDTNVGTNPIQSDRMYEALNGMGKIVTLVQYPYEDHRPAAKETVLDYWARVIEWFDRYVKNGTGVAPATANGGASR